MTTMARQSVFLIGLTIWLFSAVHSQRLKPASDASEVLTGVILPCGSRCVVQSYRQVLEAVDKCILSNTTGMVREVTQYLTNYNLNNNPTYQQVYDAMFREGRSPLCRWYRMYFGCVRDEYGQICGDGIRNAITRLQQDFETLICSQNPNYLACLLHPSLFGDINSPSQPNTSPYPTCVANLNNVFVNINDNNYYQELILRNNGFALFTALRTFGNCLGAAVRTVTVSPPTGCAVVAEDANKWINDGVNYFDFGSGGKDYVKCFTNPALHTKLTPCGTAFVNDLDAVLPGGSLDVLRELNATLYRGQPLVIAGAYVRFSSCIKQAMRQACSADTDSVALADRLLLPLDLFFDGNSGNDNIQFCNSGTSPTPAPAPGATPAPTPAPAPGATPGGSGGGGTPRSGTRTTAGSLELVVCGLLLLLSVTLNLH